MYLEANNYYILLKCTEQIIYKIDIIKLYNNQIVLNQPVLPLSPVPRDFLYKYLLLIV